MKTTGVLNSNTIFPQEIENICKEKSVSYIDAVMLWCERKGVEVEYAAALIKKDGPLKFKLMAEAQAINIIKKTAKLPV